MGLSLFAFVDCLVVGCLLFCCFVFCCWLVGLIGVFCFDYFCLIGLIIGVLGYGFGLCAWLLGFPWAA